MDQKRHWVFAPGTIIGRLDHVAVHALAVPARKGKLLERREWSLGEALLSHMRERTRPPAAAHLKDLRRRIERIAAVDDCALRHINAGDVTIPGQWLECARRRIEREDAVLP